MHHTAISPLLAGGFYAELYHQGRGPVCERTSTIGLLFPNEEVSYGEIIQTTCKKSGEGVKGGADDRLAGHIEACVQDSRAAGQFLEFVDDLPIFGLDSPFHGLYSDRVIHVGGALNILDYTILALKSNDHEG